MSPVSYYDWAHYGMWFSLFEVALGLALAIVLFRQFGSRVLRVFLVFAMAMYVAVPAFFIFSWL
jgi:Iap family predicted aminopeptidase